MSKFESSTILEFPQERQRKASLCKGICQRSWLRDCAAGCHLFDLILGEFVTNCRFKPSAPSGHLPLQKGGFGQFHSLRIVQNMNLLI